MGFWSDQRVVVTGGTGFLGTRLTGALHTLGCASVNGLGKGDYDLRRADDIARMYRDLTPTLVFHLAAVVGGIGANQERPGEFFFDNLMMGIQVLDHARRSDAHKVVIVGTVCGYPKHTPVPFREEDLWSGYPEETNAPYGIAKKALLVQSQAYRQQYGFNSIFLLPTNLYGPGDNFDPRTSHVIPALIRKCVEAAETGSSHIDVWGDGSPTRDFLFVDDAVEGILAAAERYDSGDPANLGSGREIRIADLARMVAEAVGFAGAIRWDTSKPNGQPRRCLDVTRAAERFGFQARTPFPEGLRRTVEWYRGTRLGSRGAYASTR
jgi:GDP-L-fucose synthase